MSALLWPDGERTQVGLGLVCALTYSSPIARQILGRLFCEYVGLPPYSQFCAARLRIFRESGDQTLRQ